jgi:hypothetical protein
VQTCRRELLDRTLICDPEPGAPAARPARVRAVLQLPPHSPGNRQRPATVRTALTDSPGGRHHLPPHTQARLPRRHPPRIPACRLTCTDEIFGKHRTYPRVLPPRVTAHGTPESYFRVPYVWRPQFRAACRAARVVRSALAAAGLAALRNRRGFSVSSSARSYRWCRCPPSPSGAGARRTPAVPSW